MQFQWLLFIYNTGFISQIRGYIQKENIPLLGFEAKEIWVKLNHPDQI